MDRQGRCRRGLAIVCRWCGAVLRLGVGRARVLRHGSTAGFQDRSSSRQWQRDIAMDLISGRSRIAAVDTSVNGSWPI
jgi:hypothetical protein